MDKNTICKQCGAMSEGHSPKNMDFPSSVIEITNPEKLILFRKVVVPASMGNESTFPPAIGKYANVLLQYEANGNLYLYSSDGIPTKIPAGGGPLEPATTSTLGGVIVGNGLIVQEDGTLSADAFSTDEWENLWT